MDDLQIRVHSINNLLRKSKKAVVIMMKYAWEEFSECWWSTLLVSLKKEVILLRLNALEFQ